MNIVADTSVILAVLLGEPQRQRLIDLTRGAHLMAPPSVHWEIGNALAAMLKRGRLGLSLVLKAIADYQQIAIRYADVELDESLRLASSFNLYAYDAFILRCAMKYNAPLLSLDQGLVKAARGSQVKVIEVS